MNTIHIASGPNVETFGLPPQFFAGDTPPVSTQDFPFTVSGNAIPQYTPLKRVAGVWSLWAAGDQVDAITAYEIPIGTSRAAVYTAVMANIDAIKWPAGTTEVQAMAGMSGDIKYRKLLYSGQRTGNESAYVGPGNEAGPMPLTLVPPNGPLISAVAGVAYTFTLQKVGAGGAVTFALATGSLPAGLSLNASTGVISGTPTTAGASSFTVTATDIAGDTYTGSYSIAVAAA